MAYEKQTWADGDLITKEKLNHIEEGIASIPKGDKGDTGAKGDKGDTGAKGDKGDKGADATIPKLNKIDALAEGSDVATVVTSVNSLIADLKAKGYMATA